MQDNVAIVVSEKFQKPFLRGDRAGIVEVCSVNVLRAAANSGKS